MCGGSGGGFALKAILVKGEYPQKKFEQMRRFIESRVLRD